MPAPRDVDSHQCSYTYSNILPKCHGKGEEKQHTREREDYELNVDLSSAGCRSKEQHWQAEHRIHRSLLSMPSSSFSEVEEHRGAWLQARNVHICFLCVCVCVCVFWGAERCGHMHSVSRQGSGTLKMSPESRNTKKTGRERRKCDEQTRMLWEVWDLEKAGSYSQSWRLGRIKTMAQRQIDTGFRDCTPLQHQCTTVEWVQGHI